MFRVTRRYRFSSSHRLHAPQLTEDQNRQLYGKCNHPYGHGHDYVLEVRVRGPLNAADGRAVNPEVLDGLVQRVALTPFDHRNLNVEVEAFATVVPTSENLALEICRRLKRGWPGVFGNEWPKLEGVRIAETPRNIFEIRADEIQ